tara:strand:+ start:20 stop:187 length:168 start_codon:yes stop_codon:yes gene_type:complete
MTDLISDDRILDEALTLLASTGKSFVLLFESENGDVTHYSNNKGDRLFVVTQEEQ